MTRFVDIFCGGGTATEGLTDAGLTHVVGYDYWRPAVSNMHANGWRAEVPDVTSLQSIPQADVVWASPPCTEYSSGSNHREKREHIKELVVDAIRVALTANPRAIVLENRPDMLNADQYKRAMAMLDGWHIQEHVIDAADIGSPSHRKRCFVIASRSQMTGQLWRQAPPTPHGIRWLMLTATATGGRHHMRAKSQPSLATCRTACTIITRRQQSQRQVWRQKPLRVSRALSSFTRVAHVAGSNRMITASSWGCLTTTCSLAPSATSARSSATALPSSVRAQLASSCRKI